MSKPVSQLQDGDVIPCNRCGDLITMQNVEKSKDTAKAIHANTPIDELVIICDQCYKELRTVATCDIDGQMN